jgi:hypothetical protein
MLENFFQCNCVTIGVPSANMIWKYSDGGMIMSNITITPGQNVIKLFGVIAKHSTLIIYCSYNLLPCSF